MPLKSFQRNYWALSDTTVAPLRLTKGGYPAWQGSVIASLFGAIGEYARDIWRKWRWIAALIRRIRRLDLPQQRTVLRTLDMVEHASFPLAQDAVRVTAKTLGFHDPAAWKPLSHALKGDAGNAENTFRHLNTVKLLRDASRLQGSTLTNPAAHFLAELAYQEFALRGR